MKIFHLLGAAAVGVLSSVAAVANADVSGRSGLILCDFLMGTDMFFDCNVSTVDKSVEMFINTNASEAGSICEGTASIAVRSGAEFESGWRLRVLGLEPLGELLAECDF